MITGKDAALSGLLTLAVLASMSLTPAVVIGQVAPDTPEATRQRLADREVFGFLPSWELDSAAAVDLDTLTTLAWFSLEAGRDGRLLRETEDGTPTPGWAGWTSQTFEDLLARARAADVRVVLTVERFSWDSAGRRTTTRLLGDEAARATLVQDIVDTITVRGAGGVNLDFEPLPQPVRSSFVRLVRELRAGLDAVDPSLQLTFDLTPDVTSFPVRRLTGRDAADAAVLMGYEYRTASSRIAGSVAPLRDPDGLDLRDSIDRALSRLPARRLILALPWYGRAWSTQTARSWFTDTTQRALHRAIHGPVRGLRASSRLSRPSLRPHPGVGLERLPLTRL